MDQSTSSTTPDAPEPLRVKPILERCPIDVLRALHRELDIYINNLEELDSNMCDLRYRLEVLLAYAASYLWQCIREIDALQAIRPRYPIKAELALKELRRILEDQYERWGWRFLKFASIRKTIGERMESHENIKEKSYLSAALTVVNGRGLESEDYAIRAADRARFMRVPPDESLSLEEAERELPIRRERWRRDSLAIPDLGERPPHALPGELDTLKKLSDIIRPVAVNSISAREAAAMVRESDEIEAAYQARIEKDEGLPPLVPDVAGKQVEPPPNTETDGPPLILGLFEEGPIVRGVQKQRLTESQYEVLKALIDAGKKRLSKDELVRISKSQDAVNVLDRLRKKDADWASVIDMAVTTGRGYAICRR